MAGIEGGIFVLNDGYQRSDQLFGVELSIHWGLSFLGFASSLQPASSLHVKLAQITLTMKYYTFDPDYL